MDSRASFTELAISHSEFEDQTLRCNNTVWHFCLSKRRSKGSKIFQKEVLP